MTARLSPSTRPLALVELLVAAALALAVPTAGELAAADELAPDIEAEPVLLAADIEAEALAV